MVNKMKLKTLTTCVLGVVVLFLVSMVALNGLGSSLPQPQYEKPPKKLEFTLYKLTKTKNVYTYAKAHGLYVDDAKRVRVVIELVDEALPKDYEIIVEVKYANLVQALVPINQLIDLAEDPMVKYVRTPVKPFLTGGGSN